MTSLINILNEIGTNIIRPKILNVEFSGSALSAIYVISINKDVYYVFFKTNVRFDKNKNYVCSIQIDFGIMDEKDPMRITNYNIPFKVIGNIAGVLKEYLKDLLIFLHEQNSNKKVYLDSLVVTAKSEFEDDTRRDKMYDTFIKNYLKNFYNVKGISSTKVKVHDYSGFGIKALYNFNPIKL